MDTYQIALLVAGGVLLIAMIAFVILKKDYFKYSNLLTPIMDAILNVLKAVQGTHPDNTILTTIVTVVQASVKAAGLAEELWLKGELDKDKRPAYAQEYIQNVLIDAGIEMTDNIKTIIAGAIALTCYLMPHYEET